jgi:RNA polymerase sigma-70 factor (ECF subfamily)
MDKARDIVQDIFVRLFTDRHKLQITISLKAYLFKAVHNACLNQLNQHKVRSRHHDFLAIDLPSTVDNDLIVMAELEEKIRTTVEQLPEQCRKIFCMNRYEGKKNGEIAAALGISIRTVETQISKALAILRSNLGEFLTVCLLATILC